jgi:hypothetical protein
MNFLVVIGHLQHWCHASAENKDWKASQFGVSPGIGNLSRGGANQPSKNWQS